MSKLYTEEQVIQMLNLHVEFDKAYPNANEILMEFTPIELPTDEEIKKESEKILYVELLSFIEGAKWMRNEIKGGGE